MDSRLPRSLVLALSLASSGCAGAPPAHDPSDRSVPTAQTSGHGLEGADTSSTFEDVTPSDGSDSPYHRCVRRVLLDSIDAGAGIMVCRPSFRPEYAVALVPPEPIEVRRDEWEPSDGPWTLVVATASIWSSRTEPWNADWNALDADDFHVARSSVPIDRQIAWDLEDAARMVVRRARHPRPEYVFDGEQRLQLGRRLIADGEAYEFDFGEYHGTSHSPRSGPARDLIALLDRVASAASIPSKAERADVLRQCAEQARALEDRAETLPW